MSERKFTRREFGRLGIGVMATAVGISTAGGVLEDANSEYLKDLLDEDSYQKEVTKAAIECANECGDLKIDKSMAFDFSKKEYTLVIPGLATAGLPNITDGKYINFVPMIASGEVQVIPQKPNPPEWGYDVLVDPVFKGPSDRPLVALTVDDGYSSRDQILQTIIDADATATFLIVGSVMDQDPEFIRKANDSGRITWGNHTYTHSNLTNLSTVSIQDELSRTENALKNICGATTIPFMRPPGGARSDNSIDAAAKSGFRTFLWNVSGDAGTQWSASNPQALVNYYMGLLDSQNNPWGSIILTHFRDSTAPALPGIIKGIRDRGMEPVSLDKLYEDGRV